MKGIRAGLIVSILATAGSAMYLIIYLYRWEMHRALVAGVLFLAGEIALATTLVLRRLETIRREPTGHGSAPFAPPDQFEPPPQAGTSPADERRFRWLGADRMSVFVPILLGANMIVSGVAWVVEHLARSGTMKGRGGVVERDLAMLALPVGGLVGVPRADIATVGAPPVTRGAVRVLRTAMLVVLVGLLVGVLFTLALLGRSRPDEDMTGLRSNVVISVDTRNGLDQELAARSLFAACNTMVEGQRLVELRRLETGRYLIVLEPALGEQARRRLLGCLDDGVLERVHADIQGHTITPVGG
ncbi:MAG TPA: hypothetical protein VGQ20_08435 [Acidimicrobiales bacterium]|jgi:hypothetical protein|nr:hypothetical protein [Acidimicrobiales bacterium]